MKSTTTENKKISFDGAGKTKVKQLEQNYPTAQKGAFFLNSDFKICIHDIPIFCFIRLYPSSTYLYKLYSNIMNLILIA